MRPLAETEISSKSISRKAFEKRSGGVSPLGGRRGWYQMVCGAGDGWQYVEFTVEGTRRGFAAVHFWPDLDKCTQQRRLELESAVESTPEQVVPLEDCDSNMSKSYMLGPRFAGGRTGLIALHGHAVLGVGWEQGLLVEADMQSSASDRIFATIVDMQFDLGCAIAECDHADHRRSARLLTCASTFTTQLPLGDEVVGDPSTADG